MAQKRLAIADLRGGRNGGEPPFALADNQCVEAMNVDYWGATFAHKRLGSVAVTPNWIAAGSPPAFTDYVDTLIPVRHFIPLAGSASAKEPWLLSVDDDLVVGLVGSGAQNDTYQPGSSTLITNPYVEGAEYNGKLYVAAAGSANRLLVLEHTNGVNTFDFRYAGLGTPAAPTAADTGSGSYAATVRYYKVAYTVLSGTTVLRRSELSSALSKTPSGSGTGIIVTKPATINEGETHWELYGSADGTVYHKLATTAVATTTYVDSTAPSAYSGDAPPSVGNNTPPTSWKYIAVHGNRLLGLGTNHTSTPNLSRVWFTPVLGASDVGDSERVPLANYVDLDENDGDYGTGICGNFLGSVYVFKYRQVWKLIPTGEDTAPFQKVCLTKEVGCIQSRSIVVGENENGQPALYFLSHRGPMRISNNGMEYCGADIEDIWATANLDSATIVGHGVYHNEKHQLWYWLATGSSTHPDTRLVFDVRLGRSMVGGVRGGWTRHNGASATARCSAMWNTTGVSTAYKSRKPYCGSTVAVGKILRCDTGTQDDGASYHAYVTTRPYVPGGLGVNFSIGQTHLLAAAEAGTQVYQTIVRDYGQETRTTMVDLTPSADETRVLRQFEGSDMAGAGCVQFTVGDIAASKDGWTLDALVVPYTAAEDR